MSTDAEPPGQKPCILRSAETVECVCVRLGRRKTISGISLALDYNRIVRRAFLSAANGRHRLAGSYADTGATVLEAEDVEHVIAARRAARRRPLGLDEGDAEIRRSAVVACTALERLRSLDDYYDLIENVHIFICVVIVIVILH